MYYKLCLCVIDYIMFVIKGLFLNKIYLIMCICKTLLRKIKLLLFLFFYYYYYYSGRVLAANKG